MYGFTQPRIAAARRSLGIGLIIALCLTVVQLLPATARSLAASELNGSHIVLINAGTGDFLDADESGAVNQSALPKADDTWTIDRVGSGIYTLHNVEYGRLLDADGPNRGYDVDLSRTRGTDSEWQLTQRGDGTYELLNNRFGQWLSADSQGNNVALSADGKSANSHWFIALADATPAAGSTVLLSNAKTGRFLDADPDGAVNQSIAPRAGDQWLVDSVDGNVTFRNVAFDRLLNAEAGDVNISGSYGTATQWTLTQRANGTYEVLSPDFGLWLDGDGQVDNYNVNLSSNGGDTDAHWNIYVLDTDIGCTTKTFRNIDELLFCISAADVFVHLEALQAIADANGGIRASGTPGYDQSVDYVAGLLEDAGLVVERQEFDFSLYTENAVSLSADGLDIETQTMSFSGSGTIVDGTTVAVDLDLGIGNASTSGCEPDDFVGLDFTGAADVAVLQRGACAFATKALNAQAAGAEAAVIFNQGNADDRVDIIGGTLGADVVGTLTIPVVDVSYDDGVLLSNASAISVTADTEVVTNTTENLIADLPGINPDNVAMAGAHLDSVQEGAGIQDNGTGSSTILAVALALAENPGYVPQNTLRFAWWGAEESGLIGSTEYIFNPDFGITDEEYAALAAYVNFDMVGSPNFIHGVYDADQSTFTATVNVPDGSAALEDLFEAYYSIEGIPYEDTEFSGRSDYQAFINVGIPASGLFTGAEGIKTEQQAAIWGGTAGEQYDPCYHLACDDVSNVSFEAVEISVDAIGYALFNLAGSTESVNGVPGIDVRGTTPDEVVFDGPQGTFLSPADGGASAPPHGHPES